MRPDLHISFEERRFCILKLLCRQPQGTVTADADFDITSIEVLASPTAVDQLHDVIGIY